MAWLNYFVLVHFEGMGTHEEVGDPDGGHQGAGQKGNPEERSGRAR